MTPYPLVRIGSNIHPVYPVSPAKPGEPWKTRAYSAEEKVELDRFLVESNASANLMMNDIGEARRIASLVTNSDTIFRLYNKSVEGALWKAHTPETYCNGMKGYYDDRLILNIGNEPLGKLAVHELDELKRSVDFYVGVMRLMGKSGQRATLPAWGSGGPEFFYFTDDRYWNVLKPMFEAFKEYPTNTLNLHSYFNRYGLGYGSGHVGRHEAIADMIATRMNGFIPDMYITEYGADLVAGVPGPWQEVFGANDLGETRYAEILTLGPVKAFHQRYVKGLIAYCWGAYPEWQLYDFSKAKLVKAAIIAFNRSAPTVETEPPPPAVRWVASTSRLKLGVEHANLRAEPDLNSRDLGDIHGGDPIFYDSLGLQGDWWHVRFYETEGYVNNLYFEPLLAELPGGHDEPPMPLPNVPPLPTTLQADMQRLVDIDIQMTALEAERRALLSKYRPVLKIAV